jgi:hypothetical protein
MARNKLAGKGTGRYNESAGRDYSYDKKYQAKKKQKKYRAKLNKANRDSGTYGNGDGMDKSHTKSGKLVNEKQSRNRARNGANGKSTKK